MIQNRTPTSRNEKGSAIVNAFHSFKITIIIKKKVSGSAKRKGKKKHMAVAEKVKNYGWDSCFCWKFVEFLFSSHRRGPPFQIICSARDSINFLLFMWVGPTRIAIKRLKNVYQPSFLLNCCIFFDHGFIYSRQWKGLDSHESG